jgi:hypothetical protein
VPWVVFTVKSPSASLRPSHLGGEFQQKQLSIRQDLHNLRVDSVKHILSRNVMVKYGEAVGYLVTFCLLFWRRLPEI